MIFLFFPFIYFLIWIKHSVSPLAEAMPRTVLVTVYAISYFLIIPLTPCGLSRGREVFSYCGALIDWSSPAFNKHLSSLL